ncbi:MAG: peroxide stress protein YaaA [Pseudomonadota bacterium]
MLLIVSPAKNLNYNKLDRALETGMPRMLAQTEALVERCRLLSPADLSSLMKISDKLALLNTERFQSFSSDFTKENAKAALFAFNGDVYAGIDANSLTEDDVAFAQTHMRILSGLYGLLRPLDKMQAYRLEMGTKLAINGHHNLYQFWGDQITTLLNEDIANQGDNILVNLASIEYFSSINENALDAMIVQPQFKDQKKGQFKTISFFAKKARGLMARYIIQNRLSDVAQLQAFNLAGYQYSDEMSTPTKPVFIRYEKDIPR